MSCSKSIIFSGPSGVGKGAVIRTLVERLGAVRAIATTTRAPRFNEVDGVDYHFVTKAQFEAMIENDDFLEYAIIHDHYYGSTKSSIDAVIASGKLCVLDMDIQGCQQIKNANFDAFMIFLVPVTIDVLRCRLQHRATENDLQMAQRIETAKLELEHRHDPIWDAVIVNDDLEYCVNEIETLILSQNVLKK